MTLDNNVIRLDIETVPLFSSEEEIKKNNPDLFDIWERRYCSKKDEDVSTWEHYRDKSALSPEFAKIVCISIGRFQKIVVDKPSGKETIEGFKVKSLRGDEKEILQQLSETLSHEQFQSWKLGGHNIKGFDISFIAKRMVMNQIFVPPHLNAMGKKPREITHIDTQELRQFGRFVSTSLELMCLSLGVTSPKTEISGSEVKDIFYHPTMLEETKKEYITRYCENDVSATYDCYRNILAYLS